jgi:DNA-binding transcriptional MerR regulator
MPDGGPHRDQQEEPTYAIGDLAAEFGLTARAIRFYEDEGLLAPRREGQLRIFSRRDRARLRLIVRAKRLGFSISEIRDFLGLYGVGDMQVEQARFTRRKARERIATLEQQLRDVQETLAELRDIDRLIVEHLRNRGLAADE